MSAQTITIVSGIVLLLVFALVGWNLRQRRCVHGLRAAMRNASLRRNAGSLLQAASNCLVVSVGSKK